MTVNRPTGMPPLRVLVADADSAFATDLGRVLGRDPMVEVVAVAASVRETAETIERAAPDVALIGELEKSDLRGLAQSIESAAGLAVILLVRPDRAGSLPSRDIRPAAFLRRESSAEQTLHGFLEVAAFALAAQRSPGASDV